MQYVVLKINLERSGGFAGITSSNEIDADKLPSSLQNIVKGLLDDKKAPMIRGSRLPKGVADHINYKIIIKDGTNETVIDCNQYSVDDKLKSLIAWMDRNSKKRK